MPEGRLVPPEERPAGVGQGRPGISRIARATGATTVPVAITGSDSVWPLGKGFSIPRMKRPMIKVFLEQFLNLSPMMILKMQTKCRRKLKIFWTL